MREVITTGKTVEQATQIALEQLGISLEQAEVEVLEMPQKKLFRTIPAKVCVRMQQVAVQADEKEVFASEQNAVPAKEQSECVSLPEKEQLDEREICDKQIDLTAQYPGVQEVIVYLQEIFAHFGVTQSKIDLRKEGDMLILDVQGDQVGRLIGYHGEVMEALSYLASLTLNHKDGTFLKISLDINHYRKKRQDSLLELAQRLAEKVVQTGRCYTLEPMNSYERRMIHAAVSEIEGVKSQSVGEGTGRRVSIFPADMEIAEVMKRSHYSANRNRKHHNHHKRDVNFKNRSGYNSEKRTGRLQAVCDGEDLPLFGKVEL